MFSKGSDAAEALIPPQYTNGMQGAHNSAMIAGKLLVKIEFNYFFIDKNMTKYHYDILLASWSLYHSYISLEIVFLWIV